MNDGAQAERADPGPRAWLLALAAAAVGMLAMSAAIAGEFVFDDLSLVAGNHYVHGFEHWQRWFTGTLWDTNYDPSELRETRGLWRPVVLASYATDWALGGGAPVVFHVTNLALHGANVTLLFFVLRDWVGGRWAAWLGALLFAVHPVEVESVAWITGRTDVLCVFGLLLATSGARLRFRGQKAGLALEALGTAVAFGSKEPAIVLPLLIAVQAWAHAGRPGLGRLPLHGMLKAVLPYAVVAVVFLVAHRFLVRTEASHQGLTLDNRLPLVLEAWGRYASLLVWPGDLTLGRALLRYSDGVIVPSAGYALLGAFAFVMSALGVWFTRESRPGTAIGLLLYWALLLPVSGIVWLGYNVLVSPRFLYLPMLGLALVLAAAWSALHTRRALWAALFGAALVAYAVRSFDRALDFDTEQRFWQEELTHNPRYEPAQQYFIARELNRGRPRSALKLSYAAFQELEGAGNLLRILEAVLALAPDVDRPSLAEVASFAVSLSEGRESELRLPKLGVVLRIAGDEQLESLQGEKHRLRTLAAEATSRLGDDEVTVKLAESVVRGCGDCWTLLPNLAVSVARTGRVAHALELARHAERVAPPGEVTGLVSLVESARKWQSKWRSQGTSPLHEAGFYTALGAYGRAYRAALPALENPPSEPASVVVLAELATRAGDVATARRLLRGALPRARADAILAELERQAQWSERPVPPGDWLPEP